MWMIQQPWLGVAVAAIALLLVGPLPAVADPSHVRGFAAVDPSDANVERSLLRLWKRTCSVDERTLMEGDGGVRISLLDIAQGRIQRGRKPSPVSYEGVVGPRGCRLTRLSTINAIPR